jgi:hypothetical protein
MTELVKGEAIDLPLLTLNKSTEDQTTLQNSLEMMANTLATEERVDSPTVISKGECKGFGLNPLRVPGEELKEITNMDRTISKDSVETCDTPKAPQLEIKLCSLSQSDVDENQQSFSSSNSISPTRKSQLISAGRQG